MAIDMSCDTFAVPLPQLLPIRDVSSEACASSARPTMSEDGATNAARALKALADPARLRILSMVSAQPEHEACVCDLQEPLGLSQPTVSHHLKVLTGAGFLTRTQRGSWAYYRLVPGSLDAAGALVSGI